MITWILAMEIAQGHKEVLLVNFGLKVSVVLVEGHVHTHVYVCVCVHMCVWETALSAGSLIYLYLWRQGPVTPFFSLTLKLREKQCNDSSHTPPPAEIQRGWTSFPDDQWRKACNAFFIEENGLLLLKMTAYHKSHYDQTLEPLMARDTLNYDIEQPSFVAFSERPGWKAATRLTGQSAEIFCVASGYI